MDCYQLLILKLDMISVVQSLKQCRSLRLFQAQHFSQGQDDQDFNNLSSGYMANSDANFHLGGFSAPLSGSANLLDGGLMGLEGGLEESQHYSIPLDAPQNFQSNQEYTLGKNDFSFS